MSRVKAAIVALALMAQNPQRGAPPAPATLGLEQGLLEFSTRDFTLKLVKASQTVAALEPKGAGGLAVKDTFISTCSSSSNVTVPSPILPLHRPTQSFFPTVAR